MKVYFLGTGTSQGIPVIGSKSPVCLSDDQKDKRLRVSVWIHDLDFSLVVDCGPDFRQQMLKSECPSIDAILFTHEHADHTAGLDDIRPFNFKQGALKAYGHKRVLDNIKSRFGYIFQTENRYPGAPSLDTIEVHNDQPFQVKDKTIIPISAWHGSLQVFGYRVDNFAYLTDLKTVPDEELSKFENLDVLVINALREEPHDTHFNLQEALAFIELVKPGKTYLTHISHNMGFHEEVQKRLPENVFLAYDNLEITV